MAATTVPLNTPTDQPTRRALLSLTAAHGAASAVPAVAGTQAAPPAAPPRDQHVEWLSEHFRLRSLYNDTNFDIAEEGEQRFYDHYDRYRTLVRETPPLTFEGCVAQLALLVDNCMFSELPLEELRPPLQLALRWLQVETWRESV